MDAVADKALLVAPQDPKAPAAETMVKVAKTHGVSPFRQMRELFALRFGPGKLGIHEYYSSGVFDPNLPMSDKKTYVGKIGSYEINVAASPMELTETRAFVRDKVMYTALLERLGLPTTETQAVVHKERGFGSIKVLRNPEAIASFLRDEARYPLFAKPCEGAGSIGSALIAGQDAGMLRLGNGRSVELDAFAQEIFVDYPEGFILQSALRQHADLTAMIGEAIGTLRMVTLRDETGIKPLYTVWKVPSPSAMSDNFWQSGSMVALVDDQTGCVTRCNIGTGLNARLIEKHPVSNENFEGFQIPHWSKVADVACEGHALFPEFGIVGWDIAMGPDGPVLIECNDNPFHVLWQLAAGKGILNSGFVPQFDAAAARSEAILQGRISTFRSRQRAKRGKA